jgi:hypothetical protein
MRHTRLIDWPLLGCSPNRKELAGGHTPRHATRNRQFEAEGLCGIWHAFCDCWYQWPACRTRSALRLESHVVRPSWVPPRATLATPLAPAMARSKSSVNPNKVEGTGANAGQYIREQYKNEYAAMAGDKGSRGIASADFEKKDTVQYNRDVNGGVARDKDGRKIARANRNRPPEELGLKQWDGGGSFGSRY